MGNIKERWTDLLARLALNTSSLSDAFRALLLHALKDSVAFNSRDTMHGMAPAFLLGVNRLAKEESCDTLVQRKESVLSLDSHFMSLFNLTLLLVLLVLFFLL